MQRLNIDLSDEDRSTNYLHSLFEPNRYGANEDFSLGFARYLTNPDKRSCDFLLAISDRWQGQGLGHKLMNSLMGIARNRGLETIEANVRDGNAAMLDLMANLGFKITGDGEVKRVLIRL